MAQALATGGDIRKKLRPMATRLRLRDTLLLVSRTLWIGLAGGALIQLLGRLLPIPNLLILSFVPLILWALFIMGYLLLRPLPLHQVARRVDGMLDLRERLSTALEIGQRQQHEDLDAAQQADARACADGLRPRMLPLLIERRPLMLSMVPLVLWIALAVLPNPQDLVLQERAAVQQALQQTADQIDSLQEQIAANEALSPEERAELDRLLADLEQRLRENQGNREEALADLSTAEARLQQQLNSNVDAQRASLEQMARNLQNLSGQQQTQRPTMDQAAQQLRDLAERLEQMTPEERQQFADNLSQQAAQMSQSSPNTAQNLSEAAQAMEQGNTQQAQEALERAAQSVEQAMQQQANQQAVERSISEVQQGRQSVAQAGQENQAGQQNQQGQQGEQNQQGQQGQQGEQNQQGQQGQQGQGQGQNQEGQDSQQGQQGQGEGQQGQGQSQQGGGGTDANNLGQAEGGQSSVDPNQGDQGSGQGTSESDLIYQPFNPNAQPGDPDFIQGQQGEGGQTDTQQGQGNLPGVNNPSRVPYQQVLPEYQRSAGEALDQSAIPPHLKDYVRDYFSQLEPGR